MVPKRNGGLTERGFVRRRSSSPTRLGNSSLKEAFCSECYILEGVSAVADAALPRDHEGGKIGGVDGEQDEGEGGPELKIDDILICICTQWIKLYYWRALLTCAMRTAVWPLGQSTLTAAWKMTATTSQYVRATENLLFGWCST